MFGNNNCCWIILILILLWACCGNNSWGCGNPYNNFGGNAGAFDNGCCN